MLDFTTIGRNIRTARLSQGLTQEALAEKLEVTPDYISKIENALKHPSLKILDAMADILGVDICLLLQGTNPVLNDYLFPELFDVIRDWEPETRILLLKTADTLGDIDGDLKTIKSKKR